MYYRIAIETNQEIRLKWKSTTLTSLEALFQLLRRYRPRLHDSLRVFVASSDEQLEAMLAEENNGLIVNSINAQEFLCARGIGCQEMRQERSAGKRQGNRRARTGTLAPLAPLSQLAQSYVETPVLTGQNLSALERKRFELEMGAGGDHDEPYTFTLPDSTPQLLAWTSLMNRVQQGELQP
ncbi:MAG TPA: hypothetical protein VJO32_07180 [Ktedonobacteraceae bacterium]|nr:hypothetical protein [Ktedonobacteraceae bacterium]